MVRAGRDGVTAAEASRHGQQLYFIYPGGTFRGFGKPRPAAGPQPAPGRTHPVSYRQLVLFDMPRDLAAGRLRGFPAPRDPGLAAVLDGAARDHAARHGWTSPAPSRRGRRSGSCSACKTSPVRR